MQGPEKEFQEVALAAREINTIIDGLESRATPTEASVLKRVAELAMSIEQIARCASQGGDRQDFTVMDLATYTSMIAGLLYMLSLIHN